MRTIFALSLLVPAIAFGQSSAQDAFKQLKTLAGNWSGQATVPAMPDESAPVRVTIRVVSGGDAVFHEMVPSFRKDDPTNGQYDPITMFYIDSDRLVLTHYCDSMKNRPRMAGKLSPDGKTLEFHFLDVSGPSEQGSMTDAKFTFIDANHHTEDWTTTMPGMKPMVAHIDLVRAKAATASAP